MTDDAFRDLRRRRIKPSATDPAIEVFDDEHWAFVRLDLVVDERMRDRLVVYLPGTQADGATPGHFPGARAFFELAADLGYHAVALAYPNQMSASRVRDDDDADAYERFRRTIIAGGSSDRIQIRRCESIENRLAKLLVHLDTCAPREEWSRFIDVVDERARWDRVVLCGQSQGGGHALLMSLDHEVARVICFSSPRDFDAKRDVPVPYVTRAFATPKERMYFFHHALDHTGGTSPSQFRRTLEALDVLRFGVADVDVEAPPYRDAHVLETRSPLVDLAVDEEASEAHVSIFSHRYADERMPAWRYLLTAPDPKR